MPTERALVTDGERRQSIVAVRNLGRNGVDVTVGSDEPVCPAGRSKYASRRFRYPSPTDDEDAFLRALERELRTRSHDVLLPVTTPTVEYVVKHRERLEQYARIPYPPIETLRSGLDKGRTLVAARSAGVPVPRTLTPETLDLDAVESALEYPVVVKPHNASGREGLQVCETPDEVVAAFRASTERFGPTMIQEFVPNGGEFGVYTLYDRSSDLVGLTVQRRIRTNPPDGGPSTLRETVENPELVSLADDLLSELDWCGVAMVEFRVDARTEEPKLLEINPRFWGSLALSVQAGVAFPYLLYRLGKGESTEPVLDYRVGVQARQLLGDVGHLLRRRDRLAALAEFLTPADAPRGFDVVSRDDPWPALGFAVHVAADTVARAVSDD
jgi:predicted ATP-grasp superfamily ATP-dependent carboligase